MSQAVSRELDQGLHARAPALLEPDALLSCQYFDRVRRRMEHDGPRMLMLAVLEDGVGTYLRYLGARSARQRDLFDESAAWIASPDTSRLFAFETICHVLGLEPAHLRRGLGACRAHARTACGRPPVVAAPARAGLCDASGGA